MMEQLSLMAMVMDIANRLLVQVRSSLWLLTPTAEKTARILRLRFHQVPEWYDGVDQNRDEHTI